MRGVLLIAQLTWLEARRRRIALAAVVCGLLFLAVFATGVYFSHRYQVAEGVTNLVQQRLTFQLLLVAGLYVVNFLTIAVAIMLPVDSLSGEIGSGVIQTLASKPIDRAAIVLGKWLAYWCMTAAYLVMMAGGVVLSVRLAGFPQSHLLPVLALMMLGATVLLTVTIACGVRLTTITNGIVAFAFYGVAFIAGWIEQIFAMVGNSSARYIGTAISLFSPADAMWRRAAYELQPPVMRALNFGPFGVASVPSAAMVVWAVAFVVVVLAFAVLQFRRRPL